ncbi:glycosyltransferase family 2 protein [Aquibium sp. ELW1220]|uniref:glycosyltransferase family 2 protein n=1 Tax=Aquibium sp. ELW1220 TaxID=2976766 RepID=UPI0025AFE2D4|nr:glycosyltransferase family 2 protein [Aquibium sp. ELW1220]MDN2578971.1 glycosyltransferase [Aquibium sp. ELW1220]
MKKDAPRVDFPVSFVVLSYNRSDQIEKTIFSIMEIVRYWGGELIVVDNGSTDGSAEIIREIVNGEKNVRCIFNDRNLGVSRGRNIGWELARYDYIFSLDDDIIIDTSAVDKLLLCVRSDKRIAIASPQICDATSRRILTSVRDGKISSFFFEAAFMLNKEALDKIGYLDPYLEVAGEGLDYSMRLKEKGYRVHLVEEVSVLHYDRARTDVDRLLRRRKWVFSLCYVYFKNMAIHSAVYYSARATAANVKNARVRSGVLYIVSLVFAALRGAATGRSARFRNHFIEKAADA